MTNLSTNSDAKKPFIAKQPSPFRADPYNNRGGKSGGKSSFSNSNAPKIKSVSVPKFKGGSGGDR